MVAVVVVVFLSTVCVVVVVLVVAIAVVMVEVLVREVEDVVGKVALRVVVALRVIVTVENKQGNNTSTAKNAGCPSGYSRHIDAEAGKIVAAQRWHGLEDG